MATTGGKEDGIRAWMTSVRASMANDPCRQLFEDQVQTHAFIFLDDYLEQILAGPKQGPMIELVKTPGRRKNNPRRTRAATAAAAKVKSVSLFSLDVDESAGNNVPVNSFHKALLQEKERSVQSALVSRKPPTDPPTTANGPLEKTHGQSTSVQFMDIPEINVSTETESQASAMPIQHHSSDPSSQTMAPFLAAERGAELSVIAEGDESPERTLASNQDGLPRTMSQSCQETVDCPPAQKPNVIQTDPKAQDDVSPDSRHSIPSSVNTYHSIPLDSPPVEFFRDGTRNHTEPLPSRTTDHPPGDRERNAFTAPLPIVPLPDLVHAIPLNDSSPRTSAHKSGIAGFPTLPAPSPLRKSMHVAQEAITSAIPPTVPPVSLGKRTSWLMKAREAKAMEGTNTLPGSSVAVVTRTMPRVSTAVKRKSEEMLGTTPLEPEWGKDQRKPKVAKSTEVEIVPLISKETDKTSHRVIPSVQPNPTATFSTIAAMPAGQLKPHAMDLDQPIARADSTDEGFIDLFKRTVEGLGARAGKSMGKSLGGAAAVALAEARAAAEAKVAERNKANSVSNDDLSDQESLEKETQPDDRLPLVPTPQVEGTTRRLSLSELTEDPMQCNEPELSAKMAKLMDTDTRINSANDSISTTPPDSPPVKGASSLVKPAGPVFNKPPPPVFMPPTSKQSSIVSARPKEFPTHPPPSQYTLPVAVSLGIPARLASPSHGFPPRVQKATQPPAQSSQSSNPSNAIFDKSEAVAVSTWISSTPDTEYTSGSQPCNMQYETAVVFDDDDDDSWPLEEKLAAAEPGWRPFDFSNVDKEDTWSSLPTESQGPTRSLIAEKNSGAIPPPNDIVTEVETNAKDGEQEPETMEVSDAEHSIMETSELEEATEAATTDHGHIRLVGRTTSQTSMASTASSSHAQAGFFSQASKLVNSVLGGSKKAKPELKSLQLAAAVAKKQQEEADKKTRRLKDMEVRRQVATAKKAEEERTRVLEEEKKNKEELEKRKREREENTDRRPLKPSVSTKIGEDDASKKRRLAPDTGKKSEVKKPAPKDKKDVTFPAKPTTTPVTKLTAQKNAKVTSTALLSSAAYNSTQNAPPASSTKPFIPEAKPFKVVSSSLKGKAKARPQEDDMGDKLPSSMVQSQMAARAKAQMQAAKLPTPEVPSESIELPDINSEYSDSDDEDKVRTFDPPDWAQSPELRQALQTQSTVNPDDIFGAIRPLRMEEMFRTRQSRFRARTSSANWTGTDRLTVDEIREYERRMGFQRTEAS